MNPNEKIKQIIGDKNNYIVGFANLEGLITNKFGNYVYGIVIGRKLDDRIIDSIESGPTLEYYQHYKDVNRELSEMVHHISNELNKVSISTMIVEPTLSDDALDEYYYRTLRADFSHKMAGTRAGLGWIGKTDLFVSEKFGPRLRLATVLTNHPLDCSVAPIDESRCGECNLCVKKCPAKAATGKSWNIHIEREEFFDPFKCREMCLELCSERMNQRVSICGICVSVCPRGKAQKQ